METETYNVQGTEVKTGDLCRVGRDGRILAIWVGSKSSDGWLNLTPKESPDSICGESTSGWYITEIVCNMRDVGPQLLKTILETKK